MKDSTINFFNDFGLTIINLGVAGEFAYTNTTIQESINAKFISQMKVISAQNEVDAANKFATATEAIKKQKELDADIGIKLALSKAIESSKLTWPNTLVLGNNQNLMDIWAAQNLK